MGGAAGHIRQLWEATELSFKDLYDIITKLSKGELKITEKLDGQNILLTYKNKKVLASRSTTQLKNFGETAFDCEQLRQYFKDRNSKPIVENTFVNALLDFQVIFDKSTLNLDEIFKDGKVWMNVEILCEDTENVIHYGMNQLRIHHLREIDENGKTINIFQNPKLTEIIENLQTNTIKQTNSISINNIEINDTIEKIKFLQNSAGLNDDNTLKEYFKIADKWPLTKIFLEFGIYVLKNLQGIIVTDKEKSISIITEKLKLSIEHLKNFYNEDKKIKELNKHLETLNSIGGFDSIVPTEGIVFEYNGMLFKFTGSFTPILRLIGFYRFG